MAKPFKPEIKIPVFKQRVKPHGSPKKRYPVRVSSAEGLRRASRERILNDDIKNPRLPYSTRQRAMSQLAALKARYKSSLEAERQASDAPCWGPVDGEMLTRYEVMEALVLLVETGVSIPEAIRRLSTQEGSVMPNLIQITRWRKWHPDFDTELTEAERARGMRLGEEVITELESLPEQPTREEVNRAKAISEAKAKSAARLNAKYQDKNITVHEDADPLASMTLEQMKERLAGLVSSTPGLAKQLADTLGEVHGLDTLSTVTSVTEDEHE